MKASFNELEIQSLLEKVRIFKKEIGDYQLFAITENFDYIIKLSNGKILIKIEELEADERDILTPEALAAIAERFVPAVPASGPQPQPESERNNKILYWSFASIGLLLLAVFGGLFYIDQVNESSSKKEKVQEVPKEKVMSVEEIERANPTRFLSASGDHKENLFGTKIKMDLVFKNKATLVAYHDAVIQVTYYKEDKTVIGTQNFTVNENFPPKSEISVSLKVVSLKNTSRVDWKLVSAKVN